MSNPHKDTGTRFETLVVRFLQDAGLWAARTAQHSFQDAGDADLGPGDFTLQMKAYKNTTDALREGVAGAERQAAVAKTDYGVAIVKRVRKPVSEAYAVMSLRTFARLAFELIELRKLRDR